MRQGTSEDLPVGVVANLPTLLADPLFIFPHKDGGIRVVINAKTDKGEPIVVGIGNGRIKTITPIHHGEDINGSERLNNQFRSALQAGEKVYARNENALTEAKAFDLAPVGHNYQGRYNKSKKRITTNDDLVKKYGDSFYQSANDSPRLAPNGKPSNIDQGNRKHFVIKDPTQIKSATGNNGNFDGTDANILHQSKSTNLAALEQQSAITIDDAELSALSVAELRKEVVKRYEEKKLKPEKTIDGREVKFTGVGLREVKQHSADRKVLELLDKAHELIKVAIPLWSEDHTQANPSDSIRAWHYYGAKVALNGQDYFARLVVREDVNGNIYYDNDLTTVESISGHIGDASPTKSGAATVSTDKRSISRWAHAVKSAHLNQPRFGSFHPPTNTIAIFKQGNLSTVLHELGHFFFENDIALAAELATKPELTSGEQQIVSDVSALLNWSGIQGSLQEQLDQWYSMDIEEKRGAHERTAEAFEAYLFSGKAPSIELQHAFQTFRTWLISVYKSLKDFLASHPEAGKLNEEVSAIFDRMLATEEEIKLAEKARSLMPLFESAQKAGMSEADFAAYQALGVEATNTAIDALQAKALGDMEWMGRAHTKYLKALQKKHDELRRELRSQARTDIMAQPVYRAYSFLTGKLNQDDKIAQPTTAKSNPKHVDPSIDSLFVAIAKLGGLQRGQLSEEWNYAHQGRVQMPVFGKPVVRKNGGLSIETMAESLMDEGYLNMDEHGKYDLHEFEEKFSAELRGAAQYAHGPDVGNIMHEDHKAGEAVINPEGLGAGRFELSELRGMGLPEAVLNLMINLKMTAKDGLHPDIVSDLFGFSSGDELVNALASAENPKAAIEHLTDQRMLQEHGELATPEAVEEAADRAVHNKFRERLLRSEANALAKATGSLRLLGNAAKEYTQAMINRLKVRDIKPINYSRAEAKAARAAEQAHRKGDTEQAAIEKRNQVLNMQAFRAAVAAQDHIDKMLRYFKRLGGDGQKIDAEYIDVIRGMLDKFDLRDQSGKHLDEQARLRTWVQSQLAEGQLPAIAESLLSPQERAAYTAQVESRDEHGELIYQDDEEALKLLADAIDRSAKRSYKDATYEELQGLYETIKQMEHLGRLKHKLLTAQDERDAEAIYTEITDGIILHGGVGGKNTRTPNDVLGKMLVGIKDFGSAHIKIATWARIMDGGIDNGPVWRFLVKPANARATQETTMKAAATKELDAIMRPILAKATLRDKSGKGKYFASIGTSLNWQERFSFLLNMGNESNLQRLMGGGIATVKENLTMAQLLEVVGTLSWDEALAVQKIWDHFESYRPLIAEKEKRISGAEPQWVAIRPIDIKVSDGRVITLHGGYYPVKFDPRVNRMAEAHASAQDAKNLMKASYSAATTNRSFIKQRVEEVTGRPLLLNLTGLYSGVNDVIHDLAWHEWVIDANKILKKIDPAIREFYGADVKKQFDTWRNDIVVGQRKLDHGIEKAAAFARQYVSASALTFNLMSAAMQPLGIANTMARIGAHWVGQGIAIYAANPLQATKDAQQKSEWLRNRTRTRFRELNELRNQVQGQTAAKELMGRYGYWLMMRAQMMVDIPSWHGGYEKAIAQGFDEDTAIALADQAVKDSQGGGEEVDQSGIERGHALVKLFTAFYGFMGTTLNTAYGSTITEKSKAKIAINLLLTLSVPAVLGSLLRSALTPGDDDDENLAETLIREQLAFVVGLIAFGREFAGITKDNHMGYSGPTGLRLIPDTFKLADQIKQGDFDTAFRKQFVNVLGDISGLPAVQINRTWTGIEALNEGKTTNPAAIGFGFAKNH